MSKVLIVGGGAAGMFASIIAARNQHEVHVFEKNEKLGKKVYITGKGRCNVTNAGSMEELFSSVTTNEKFMYSAFHQFNNFDMMEFFEEIGVTLKTERGNRVFPASDRANTIIQGLENEMRKQHVQIHLHQEVSSLLYDEDMAQISGIKLADGRKISGDAVIIGTGGLSYPTTGSTGDGYTFAKQRDMEVTKLYPSLVPMNTKEDYIPLLQGLSLKNVTLSIYDGDKKMYEEFGEMMFTHFGITGPLVLTASSYVGPVVKEKQVKGFIDLKPAVTEEQLDQRILKIFDENKNKQFKNVTGGLLPAKLEPVVLSLSGIHPDKKVNEISKEERQQFIMCMKAFPLTITGLRDFKEAIITKGGVSVKEIIPKTMESKKVPGLYFIGEVLDVDAVTGGFNLQIAWSTAYAAASHIY